MLRFRPNLVVSGNGMAPYAEDEWSDVVIGDQRFVVSNMIYSVCVCVCVCVCVRVCVCVCEVKPDQAKVVCGLETMYHTV